jgi:hypothetical protein
MKLMTGDPGLAEAIKRMKGNTYFNYFMDHVRKMRTDQEKITAYSQTFASYHSGRLSVLIEIVEGVDKELKNG